MIQERNHTDLWVLRVHVHTRIIGRLSLCDNVTGLPPASMFHVAVVIWQATASLLATAWC